MGKKPSDYYTVALCGGPDGCHARQHRVGEQTFWQGKPLHAIIAQFIKTSPVRHEIEAHMRERGHG